MKKRSLAVALALTLCLGLMPQAALALAPAIITPNPYSDLEANTLVYNPAIWAHYAGVTSGTGNGKFSPNGVCTRAQAVTFLWRALGSPKPVSTNNPFTDVKSTDYFYKSVLWAVEQNVTSGSSPTTFSPNTNCTNAQVVTFLWRAKGSPAPMDYIEKEYEEKFPGQYFVKALAWGTGVSLFIWIPSQKRLNTPDTVNAPCLRGDLVAMLYNNAGSPNIKQYGKPIPKFTSCVPSSSHWGLTYSHQYYIALDIAATQVLTSGEKGSRYTFTPEGTRFDIFKPDQFDYAQRPNGNYGQCFESAEFVSAKLTHHWSIRVNDGTQHTLDIAGAADKEGSWIIAYPPQATINQHYDLVKAPNDAAGNIRAYLKSMGGNFVMKTDNGLEITTDKAKATAFYFIRAEQADHD
ncbi:MAG: S-layer homology domain-containing protein [Oscillospiraceae bacterium]